MAVYVEKCGIIWQPVKRCVRISCNMEIVFSVNPAFSASLSWLLQHYLSKQMWWGHRGVRVDLNNGTRNMHLHGDWGGWRGEELCLSPSPVHLLVASAQRAPSTTVLPFQHPWPSPLFPNHLTLLGIWPPVQSRHEWRESTLIGWYTRATDYSMKFQGVLGVSELSSVMPQVESLWFRWSEDFYSSEVSWTHMPIFHSVLFMNSLSVLTFGISSRRKQLLSAGLWGCFFWYHLPFHSSSPSVFSTPWCGDCGLEVTSIGAEDG